MKLSVDHEADALYLHLTDEKIVESDEVEPGIILDYDAENRVVGIEMLNLSFRAPAADTHRLFLSGVEAAASMSPPQHVEPLAETIRPVREKAEGSMSSVLREDPPKYGK